MESFLNHIRIECRAQEEGRQSNPLVKAWLVESRGLPDQMEEMLDKILTNNPFVRRSYKTFQENPSYPMNCRFDMYPLVKDVHRNFIGPKSFLSLKFVRSSNAIPNVSGVYEGSASSVWNRDENYIEKASVNLECRVHPRTPLVAVIFHARQALAHELLHAYEDYNRQVMGSRSLGQSLGDRDYPEVEDKDNLMQWMAYVLDPAEQRAFIAGAVSQIQDGVKLLQKAGKLDRFENIRNFDILLQQTEFWPIYENIRGWMEGTQWDRMPEFRQKKFVEAYNKLVPGDDRSPFSRKITTYNQFLKKIRYRWSAFEETLKKRVSQAAADALYKAKPVDPAFPKKRLSESIFYQAY